MHLLSHPAAIGHHSNIGGNDCRDACLAGCIDDLVHQGNVLSIYNGIDGQIALDAMLAADVGNLFQVADGERRGRVCPHVQFLYAEVDAVGSGLKGGSQRLA